MSLAAAELLQAAVIYAAGDSSALVNATTNFVKYAKVLKFTHGSEDNVFECKTEVDSGKISQIASDYVNSKRGIIQSKVDNASFLFAKNSALSGNIDLRSRGASNMNGHRGNIPYYITGETKLGYSNCHTYTRYRDAFNALCPTTGDEFIQAVSWSAASDVATPKLTYNQMASKLADIYGSNYHAIDLLSIAPDKFSVVKHKTSSGEYVFQLVGSIRYVGISNYYPLYHSVMPKASVREAHYTALSRVANSAGMSVVDFVPIGQSNLTDAAQHPNERRSKGENYWAAVGDNIEEAAKNVFGRYNENWASEIGFGILIPGAGSFLSGFFAPTSSSGTSRLKSQHCWINNEEINFAPADNYLFSAVLPISIEIDDLGSVFSSNSISGSQYNSDESNYTQTVFTPENIIDFYEAQISANVFKSVVNALVKNSQAFMGADTDSAEWVGYFKSARLLLTDLAVLKSFSNLVPKSDESSVNAFLDTLLADIEAIRSMPESQQSYAEDKEALDHAASLVSQLVNKLKAIPDSSLVLQAFSKASFEAQDSVSDPANIPLVEVLK